MAAPASLGVLSDALGLEIHPKTYPSPLTAQIALEYVKLGHDVVVLTTASVDETQRYFAENLSVVVVPTRPRWQERASDMFAVERRLLVAEIRAARHDVVHAHWTYEFALAAQEATLPALVTVHDWAPAVFRQELHPYRAIRWAMQVRVLARATHLTAPSRYIANRVARSYGKDCKVIPNGVDTSQFSAAHGGNLRVGMLNMGFSRLKNVSVALRAWPRISAAVPGATLVLAGLGFEKMGPAHQWARKNRLDGNVDFVGIVEPSMAPNWYDSLDVFLHTSLEESFGVVLVEAMASGLPIAAGRRSGAVPEVLGGSGTLVDVTSPAQVAAAVIDLLRRAPSERQREGAIRRAENFEISTIAARHAIALEVAAR